MKIGYKKTDIGIIPKDWNFIMLGKITDIISGGTPSTNQPRFWNGNIPWCVPTDITQLEGYKYFKNTTRKITIDGIKFSAAQIIPANSIIMTSRATIGECAINLIPLATNQGFKNFIPHENINHEFLYYMLSRHKQDFIRLSSGSTFLEITKSKLTSFYILIPPKKEQIAIANILSDADKLIENIERLIIKKQAIKKGAMQQLLTGKKRLSGFKEKWQEKTLGKIATMKSGGTPLTSNKNYYDGNIPWVTIADMSQVNKFIYSTQKNISVAGLNNSAAQIYPAGTVLYAMYASLGECCIAGISLCSHQAILAIRPKSNLYNEFLFYYLTSIKSQVKNMGQQSTQNNLNKQLVSEFNILLPNIEEQTAIANIISEIDSEIETLKNKLNKYRQIKIGIMQELLTGKKRIV